MAMTVSVIIPAYNSAAFIRETLDSVAYQSRLPDEVIIVDDGSSDDTYQVITEWKSNHKNITVKILQQNNQGVSAARNLGINTASKDLIAFLDSDDLWLSDHLETLIKSFELVPDCILAFADMTNFNRNKVVTISFLADKPVIKLPYKSIDNFNVITDSLWNTLINGSYIPTCASMVKRNAALRIGGFDHTLKTSEDRHFFLKLSRLGKVGYFNRVIAWRRLHDENLTHDKNNVDVARNGILVIEKILGEINSFSLSPEEGEATDKALDAAILNYLYISAHTGLLNYFRALVYVKKLSKRRYRYFSDFKLCLVAIFNSFK